MQITLNIFQALLMKTNKHKQTNKITSHFQFLLRLNRLKFQGGNSFQVQNKLGLHNFSKLQSCILKNFDCDRPDEYSTEQNSKVFDHQCKSDHQSHRPERESPSEFFLTLQTSFGVRSSGIPKDFFGEANRNLALLHLRVLCIYCFVAK